MQEQSPAVAVHPQQLVPIVSAAPGPAARRGVSRYVASRRCAPRAHRGRPRPPPASAGSLRARGPRATSGGSAGRRSAGAAGPSRREGPTPGSVVPRTAPARPRPGRTRRPAGHAGRPGRRPPSGARARSPRRCGRRATGRRPAATGELRSSAHLPPGQSERVDLSPADHLAPARRPVGVRRRGVGRAKVSVESCAGLCRGGRPVRDRRPAGCGGRWDVITIVVTVARCDDVPRIPVGPAWTRPRQ